MNVALLAIKWQFALVYFDDIVAFSRSPAEQIEHFKHLLSLLSEGGVTL